MDSPRRRCPRCGLVYDPTADGPDTELTGAEPTDYQLQDHQPDYQRRSDPLTWFAGSWLRPAATSVVMLAAGATVVGYHRDPGSVFAAVFFLILAVQSWRWWAQQRPAPEPPAAARGRRPG